jgi:cullin 3
MKVKPDVIRSINNHFITTFIAVWNDYLTAIIIIRDALMYMNRVYVDVQKLQPVRDLGIELFRQNIVQDPDIQNHLRQILKEMDLTSSDNRRGESFAFRC